MVRLGSCQASSGLSVTPSLYWLRFTAVEPALYSSTHESGNSLISSITQSMFDCMISLMISCAWLGMTAPNMVAVRNRSFFI